MYHDFYFKTGVFFVLLAIVGCEKKSGSSNAPGQRYSLVVENRLDEHVRDIQIEFDNGMSYDLMVVGKGTSKEFANANTRFGDVKPGVKAIRFVTESGTVYSKEKMEIGTPKLTGTLKVVIMPGPTVGVWR